MASSQWDYDNADPEDYQIPQPEIIEEDDE
jgi:hypothetical protein